MPIIPAQPSDVTRLARVAATYVTDPEKKSRTFVAPVKYDIGPLAKAEFTGRGSVLAVPAWKSPAFRGGRIFLI
jgi:hypothetical protein